VRVPGPPVEACIALSILLVAAELTRERASLAARWPWLVAFAFGLLHGFGFAGALSQIGLPQHAIPLALLFFNIGVETGQLLFVSAVVAVATGAMQFGKRFDLPAWSRRIPSYAIGSLAAFWVIQRIAAF
jgi:hypothetical protein